MADSAREAELRRLFDEAMALAGPAQRAFVAGVADELLRERLHALVEQDASVTATSLRDPLVRVEASRRIGNYELLRELGSGGMGVVMLARQVEPIERLVAVKLVANAGESSEVLQRFHGEQKALGRMDHPGIARVLDGGTTEAGLPYFVMEYVRGEPITTYCDRRRLSVAQRMRLLVAVCEAVQHAHQKGVIHRDLKPGNLLVTEVAGQPQPKVIDFGVARAVAGALATAALTRAGDVVGTLLYMSPEQAMPDHELDTRSDIYSLGVVGYELAVGQPPLAFGTDPASLLKFRTDLVEGGAPAPLAAIAKLHPAEASERAARRASSVAAWRRDLGQDLGAVLTTALQPDRNRRYPSASELAADLQHYLAGEPVRARVPTWTYLTWRFVQRHRRLVLAAALSVAAIVAGTVATVVSLFETRAARDQEAAARRRLAAVVERQRAVEEFSQFAQLYGDPGTSGVAPSLRQTLLAAEGMVGVRWRDRPRERAAVRAALGRTLLHLGEPAAAREQLQQAWEVLDGVEHEDLPWSLEVLANLRRAARDSGDAVAAREHLVRMLQLGASAVREMAPELSTLLASMAGAASTAVPLTAPLVADCTRAIDLVEASPERAEVLRSTGSLLFGVALAARADAAPGADALLVRIERIARKLYGADIEFAFLLGYLAENRWRLGDHDAALALADELLAVLARLQRPDHWLAAQAARLRALAAVARGDDAVGEPELLRLRDRLLPFRATGNAQVRAAVAAPAELTAWLLANGRLDAFLRTSLARWRARAGETPPACPWWPVYLDGLPAPALEAALGALDVAGGSPPPIAAGDLDALRGAASLRLGRADAAAPLLDRALAASPRPGPELLADVAVVRRRGGDEAGAARALEQLEELERVAAPGTGADAALRLRCEVALERARTTR